MSIQNKEIVIDSIWGECQQQLMTGQKPNKSKSMNYEKAKFIIDSIINKDIVMRNVNNRKELHDAGHERRQKNFAIQRIARNIDNEKKAKRLELFYQNTVLLLTGYKPIKITI